jgi:hypothetical protein
VVYLARRAQGDPQVSKALMETEGTEAKPVPLVTLASLVP